MILKKDHFNGDESALLCEACGYLLEGLELEGACPECGRDRGLSDPERRVGSAWQRGVSLGAWVATGLGLLLRPRAFWDEVRVEESTGRNLAMMNAGAASALGVGIPLAVIRTDIVLCVVLWMTLSSVIWILTAVEQRGIRFWGRVHGARITPHVAWSVCGHASVGWVIGGALCGAGWVVGGLFELSGWGLGGRGVVTTFPVSLMMLAAPWVIGLLIFETLTYAGMRRMRFANAPRE